MDPYIEACGLWGDFHRSLISSIHAGLAEAAPLNYMVRTDERYYVELVEAEGKKTRNRSLPQIGAAVTATLP